MTDTPDIARLKAEAAQAAADAAAAKAAAAQAALEAALASGAATGTPQDAPAARTGRKAEGKPAESAAEAPAEPAAPDAPAQAPAAPSSSEPEGYAAQVRDGYAFDGRMLPVGTYLETAPASGDPVPVKGVRVGIPMALLNRHALVAGATGTGKTRTLQLLAEGLSSAGVPVFLSDIKGDLTGMAEPGATSPKLESRTASTGQDWKPASFPMELFTLGGQGKGTPIRTTITEFGPVLLARVLRLNETQTSALQLVFHWADSQGMALLDLKDLRAVINYLVNTDAGKAELKTIGGVSEATAGVILRELAALEASGGDAFFGEPGLSVQDLMRVSPDGRGIVSSLELEDIQSQGTLFSTFLMWLLGELFEVLPEVGDLDKPKMVFFFDEAHLLFADATKAFMEAVTRTVRLIRSKGVGIVFITQSPTDVPNEVLAQLGSRVQHALRAHTPDDAANLKKAVSTFPTSPLDLTKVLTSLGTGQAVVSVLDEKGRPAPVTAVVVDAPASVMGAGQDSTVQSLLSGSPLAGKYATVVDNESAYELLEKRIAAETEEAAAAVAAEEARVAAEKAAAAEEKERAKAEAAAAKAAERAEAAAQKAAQKEAERQAKELERLQRQAAKEAERQRLAAERAAERRQREIEKTIGSVGRQIVRSVLGNVLRKR
ncbi:helicase HerA-like domain-containing protein [Actinomyces marmotae]|uniref:helicase HerA-like domain-containing protein n=1 Tax=Actinomyces marmotae TaxID=2737173 RepID=UPI001356D92A|nr:helicase HerA-like domain-containing protein [Actinomyces marmotae]